LWRIPIAPENGFAQLGAVESSILIGIVRPRFIVVLFARAHAKIIARPNDFGNRKQESFTAEDTEIIENDVELRRRIRGGRALAAREAVGELRAERVFNILVRPS
jgi:hypothetical protein